MNVAHVIVNNLGGITSLVQNLVLYKGSKALPQELFILDIKNNPNAKAILDTKVQELAQYFTINPLDNWYYTYGKLAKNLSQTNGILVSNDQYDLIMLQFFNIPRKVVQLVHDPYNLELSLKFHEVIDCFVTHSHYIWELLLERLPHRINDIKFIPYGIPMDSQTKRVLKRDKPLRLVFLGRHDKAKGVFDLYEIDKLLKLKNIYADWLILGKGSETKKLKEQWRDISNVQFESPISQENLNDYVGTADVMVFPTKFEGFPVALLECMSQGCVPVVTDLPGGIRELVIDGENGFKCEMNDNEAFTVAIEMLHNHREYLLEMQKHVSNIIFKNYNATTQSPIYQELFHSLAIAQAIPKHHAVQFKIGSRLDHPLIPNIVTSFIRNLMK
jgi:glycosyltransferase involved in cell wall biosynthesis